MNEIRRFTEPGLIAARELLNQLRQGEDVYVEALLTSELHPLQMTPDADYEVTSFDDRQHAAEFLAH